MTTVLTQEEAQQLLELFGPNGEHWGQHHFELEGKFCLLGAWRKVRIAFDLALVTKILIGKLEDYVSPWESIVLWNDDPKRTFQDVKNAIEKCTRTPITGYPYSAEA